MAKKIPVINWEHKHKADKNPNDQKDVILIGVG